MLYRAIISEAPLPSALFVLLFVLVLVLSESAQADERYSYSTSFSIASQLIDPQQRRPTGSKNGIAGVRTAIEYEYRFAEYEYAYEEFGLRRLVSNQTLFVSGLPKNFPECKIHPRENSNFL